MQLTSDQPYVEMCVSPFYKPHTLQAVDDGMIVNKMKTRNNFRTAGLRTMI
jgi:hypothetical protein